MSYQVLARKWRPQTFADVIGQKHIITALTNSLSLNRIHHAWLFSGMHGVGKTSIARLLAKSLNCKVGITVNPCRNCNNCHEIEQGKSVDLIEIDAASRTKVEDTRDLLSTVQYSPTYSRFKIYLIDEVHMLSRHSFNALLKTLEEPPIHVKFLLATTEPKKLPVTILSRCLQFNLKSLSLKQIQYQLVQLLDKEQIDYDLESLELLSNVAQGSLRDALSLTDQAIAIGNGRIRLKEVRNMLGIVDQNYILSLIEAIIQTNGKLVITILNDIASYGIEWESILIEIQIILHKISIIKLLSNNLPSPSSNNENLNQNRLCKLASIISLTNLQAYYRLIAIGRKELPFSPNYRMGIEMIMLRILSFNSKQQTSNKK